MFQKHEQAKKDSPKWMHDNIHYECLMGSYAYGVNTKESDKDIYGFFIPPKEMIFPKDFIRGFDKDVYNFEHFTNCYDDVDFTIFNIVKYFYLCMGINPNIIDSLFVPNDCIIEMSNIGKMVRDNRYLFLSKLSWKKFKGYAYSNYTRLTKSHKEGKRKVLIDKYGYDVKEAYHCIRIINELQQILRDENIDLRMDKERLISIRNGEYTLNEIKLLFQKEEKTTESLYEKCKLPDTPRVKEIRNLLKLCLDEAYSSS